MLLINRDREKKKELENKHYEALKNDVSERVSFTLEILNALGLPKIEDKIENIKSIPTRTKTRWLNTLIGNNTKYTKQEEWINFNDEKNIRPDILSLKEDIIKNIQSLTEELVKEILIGEPVRLIEIEKTLLSNKKIEPELRQIYNVIFNYDEFRDKETGYNAFKLIEISGINSCPYCNFSQIHTNKTDITENQYKEGMRSEIDHYFTQSGHELLAISFYNLIPSCLPCNLRLKGKEEFKITEFLHPYINGFDEIASQNISERVYFEYKYVDTKIADNESFTRRRDNVKISIVIPSDISINKKIQVSGPENNPNKLGNIPRFQLKASYDTVEAKNKVIQVLQFIKNEASPEYINSMTWFSRKVDDNFHDTYMASLGGAGWNPDYHYQANYSKLAKDIFIQYLKSLGIFI